MDEDRPTTRIAAHGLCVEGDRILLVRMTAATRDEGRWGLPGGGLDWGETPEDAVVREFQEETGLVAAVDGLAGVFSQVFERSADRQLPPLHFLSIVYRVRTVAGAPLTHELDGTTDLAAWQPFSDLDDLPLVPLARYGLSLL